MISYSRVECFKKCKYQYFLRYIEKLKVMENYDADNALKIGIALHECIELGVDRAVTNYKNNFPITSDEIETEAIKLEVMGRKALDILPKQNLTHEFKLEDKNFIGFIDLLEEVEDGVYNMYDFKYSNNVDSYMESGQLHVYKHYFEKLNKGKKINKMYFLFVPKTQIKQKKGETYEDFRLRLYKELELKDPFLMEVKFDESKVESFETSSIKMKNAEHFEKSPTRLCNWCDYQKYCESDGKEKIDMLPKNEKVGKNQRQFKRLWFYGLPYSGKTFLANKFPNALMLNTDGNTNYVDSPRIHIKDEVIVKGRLTERKYAWEVFKEVIGDLEKEVNDFETIVVDLVEDTYEMCRQWYYAKMGITHESDQPFKAWDIIRTEFLSTLKRLISLDYNIILISHEDASRDVTKKSGDKITSIKPNLSDKVALKLSGMMSLTCRITNDSGERKISFKNSDVVFGGGRLAIDVEEIPCEYQDLMSLFEQEEGEKKNEKVKPRKKKTEDKPEMESPKEEETETLETEESTPDEQPKRRSRRRA